MAEEVRDKKGRFGKGHKGGPGRPALKAYNRFRQMLLDSVDDDEFKAVVQVLVEQAKAGEAWAVKEFFDRMCGKSQQAVELTTPQDAGKLWAEFLKNVAGVTPGLAPYDVGSARN